MKEKIQKTDYKKIKNTVNTNTHITKTATHYKTHTHTHPHITKPTHTHTHTLQNPHIHTPTHYKIHAFPKTGICSQESNVLKLCSDGINHCFIEAVFILPTAPLHIMHRDKFTLLLIRLIFVDIFDVMLSLAAVCASFIWQGVEM